MPTGISAPGGVIVLPDMTDNSGHVHHLAVGAGKEGTIYVVDRDNMGKWNPSNNNNAYQVLNGALPDRRVVEAVVL